MPTTADKNVLCCRIVFKSSLILSKNMLSFMFSVRGFWFEIYECETHPRKFLLTTCYVLVILKSEIHVMNFLHFWQNQLLTDFETKLAWTELPKKNPETQNLQRKIFKNGLLILSYSSVQRGQVIWRKNTDKVFHDKHLCEVLKYFNPSCRCFIQKLLKVFWILLLSR